MVLDIIFFILLLLMFIHLLFVSFEYYFQKNIEYPYRDYFDYLAEELYYFLENVYFNIKNILNVFYLEIFYPIVKPLKIIRADLFVIKEKTWELELNNLKKKNISSRLRKINK